ncbi:MAG: hypothetical protein LAT81_01200 [Oceanicaulis sp.]|nr:hypothetical protein [Oceanicaulis sp.]
MTPVLATGLQAFNQASARMNAAADLTVRNGLAPTDGKPRQNGWSDDIISARIEMIRAHHQAAAAATSIRTASDMVGKILDVTA